MGCRILEDPENGACFYCSTTDVAFGPVMQNREEAEMFLEVLPHDPRIMDERHLMDAYADFCQKYVCECGTLRDEYDAEYKAGDLHPNGCQCGNNGGGDCEWCLAKVHYLDPTERYTDADERFVCHYCVNKRQDKWIERHG